MDDVSETKAIQDEIRRRVESKAFRGALWQTMLLLPVTFGLIVILLPARVDPAWRLRISPFIAIAVSLVVFEALRLLIARRITHKSTCPNCRKPFVYERQAHRRFVLGYAYDYGCMGCGHRKTVFRAGRLREE